MMLTGSAYRDSDLDGRGNRARRGHAEAKPRTLAHTGGYPQAQRMRRRYFTIPAARGTPLIPYLASASTRRASLPERDVEWHRGAPEGLLRGQLQFRGQAGGHRRAEERRPHTIEHARDRWEVDGDLVGQPVAAARDRLDQRLVV